MKKCAKTTGALLSMLLSVSIANASERVQFKPLPQTCETSLALSAAPEYLRAKVSVYALMKTGFKKVQTGDNPFTCIVNRDDPRVLKPTCFDAEGAQAIVPKIMYFGEQILKGTPVSDINKAVNEKFVDGTFMSPKRAGIAYMLSRYNRPVNRQTGELGFFPPHVMFYAPNLNNTDIGHDMRFHDPKRPLPMIAYGGPQGYMIMMADDGVERSRTDLNGCPNWVYE